MPAGPAVPQMGRFVGKVKQRISFPEHLDMEPYMAHDCLDEQPAQYSLYGVVVHQGSSAHYGEVHHAFLPARLCK